VSQRGSLNAPDRLRFDFSHNQAVARADLEKIEAEVNGYIRQNAPVETRIMTPDDARALGAQALFGEKYGDEVRVVSMGHQQGSGKGADKATYSLELCGGTHVTRTGDIGAFVLLGDSASSAGVRRIEALTGAAALGHLRARDRDLGDVAEALKSSGADVPERVRALLDERRSLLNEVAQLRRDLAMSGGGTAAPEARDLDGTAFMAQVLTGLSGKDLPPLVDEYKARLGSGAVLLIAEGDGKAAVAAGVTPDLTDRFSAVDLVRAAVAEMGGKGGGGRPDLAQGGARDASNADAAIAAVEAILKG
jgi:alanyl-tRNA synthetase